MAEIGTIQISLTSDEAHAILDGIDNLVTSSATANLLATVRAKIEDALVAPIPDHPPPLNIHMTPGPITSQATAKPDEAETS